MWKPTQATMIWNGAWGDDPLRVLPGDRALRDMLRAHSLTMNGGVLHAIECLTADQLNDAEAGYRFYGFDAVASLLSRARSLNEAGIGQGTHEGQLDKEYDALSSSDESLVVRFERRLKSNPSDFESLRLKDIPKAK
jgi:hypothetical protein